MKESHRKGLASHPVPESCVVPPQGVHRSVDRGTCRPGMELRNLRSTRVPTVFRYRKAIPRAALRRAAFGLCAVEDPGMYGYSSRENRETQGMPVVGVRMGRPGGEGDES
jgi:hypothetical protein